MKEIDDIQRALESPITESGDYISDTYLRAIEIATAPTIWPYVLLHLKTSPGTPINVMR
jgi:hypothetical protein